MKFGIYGFFTAIVIVFGGVSAALAVRPTLNPKAITMVLLTKEIQQICPGDIIVQETRATVNRPSIIKTVRTIVDKDTRLIVPGTETTSPPFPRPIKETFDATLEYPVPEHILPGTYEAITAFVADSQNSETEFVVQPFIVMEDCSE